MEAVKRDCMLKEELDLPLIDSIFWTDSTIVLWYLANEDKRFQTFVANRISRILNSSTSTQWRHISSKDNPADDCSRGLTAEEICKCKHWLSGPSFLLRPEREWPILTLSSRDTQPNGAEVRRDVQIYTTEESLIPAVDRLLNRYSSWHQLRKAVCWLLRFLDYLKGKPMKPTRRSAGLQQLSPANLGSAKAAIVRYVQKQHFAHNALKSDRLQKLKPMMSTEDVLCVGGQLRNSDLPTETKHPWILPANHHVTKLIVNHVHVQLGHAGTECVLAETRMRFWIVSGRSAVKSVIGRCIFCKRAPARAVTQEMADLPPDRVTPGNPPFTSVGVDYFGPIAVKRGRVQLKHYGCLFTCLATRAIHLEVACSLDTDAFLNVLYRFIARRGKPSIIRSDNGTNFVGAKAELASCVKNWNINKISEALLQQEIKWIFNPPGASHMGGVWEHQIRTVRTILHALLQQQQVDDDTLNTVFCIAENIVNGRPITKLSDDPSDDTPLTPNHLLLLRSGPVCPPCVTSKQDLYRRR